MMALSTQPLLLDARHVLSVLLLTGAHGLPKAVDGFSDSATQPIILARHNAFAEADHHIHAIHLTPQPSASQMSCSSILILALHAMDIMGTSTQLQG